ncbi:MAG: MFS transporter [Pseudomonadales bacterium]
MSSPTNDPTIHRGYTLALLVLVFTSSHVDRQIVAILAQPIKETFAVSDTELGLLTGVMFAIFYATLGMPMAMWADRGNRRNIIALAIALWSGMTALCGMATSFVQLLLARIGVGVGEAGSNPPSHSIIADLYPPEKRATAMAIFAVGVNLGIMLGYLIGGWVNEWLDWRWAFFIAGAPGLGIALLVRFTLSEPPRGYSEPDRHIGQPPPFIDVVRAMLSSRIIRNNMLGTVGFAFASYAVVAWAPTWFMRSHHMTSGEVGTILALMIGLGGGLGTFFAGWCVDRLVSRSPGWQAWINVVAVVLIVPFASVAYTTDDSRLAVMLFIFPAVFGGTYIGTNFALLQNQIPIAMRATAAAINLFVLNILGLGLGPLTVGAISDALTPAMGDGGLGMGLLAMNGVLLWAGAHYLRTGWLLHRERHGNGPA